MYNLHMSSVKIIYTMFHTNVYKLFGLQLQNNVLF